MFLAGDEAVGFGVGACFFWEPADLVEGFEVLWHATKATMTRIRVTDLRVRTKYGMGGSYVISTTGDKALCAATPGPPLQGFIHGVANDAAL